MSAQFLACGAPDCPETAASAAVLTRHHELCQKWRDFQQKQVLERRERAAAGPGSAVHLAAAGGISRKRKILPRDPVNLEQRKRRLGSPGSISVNIRSSPEYDAGGSETIFNEGASGAFDMADMDSETANPPPANPTPANPPPAAPLDLNAGRPTRMKKLLARYRDILPEPVPVVENADPPAAPPGNSLPRVNLIVRDTFKTGPDIFGLWREYLHRLTYDPDSLLSLEDLSKQFPRPPIPPPAKTPAIPPTANRTTTLLMNWVNNGNTTKSEGQVNALVRDVILDPDFDAKELANFDAGRANKQVDTDAQASSPLLGNFKETSVEIEVPSGSVSVPPRFFAVPGLYYREPCFRGQGGIR
ncbi:hypothetical protein K438DRAFT_1769588 [Mycena galopus ATCC 62051]|nr:hypothetical protein K438DRAFT_1769588 [Mycena galopus ATCC 62051]